MVDVNALSRAGAGGHLELRQRRHHSYHRNPSVSFTPRFKNTSRVAVERLSV